MKLSKAQLDALRFVKRRNYPAGEPRLSWLNASTASVLLREGLIEERAGTEEHTPFRKRGGIVDLTPSGRAALSGGDNVSE